MNTYFLGIDIGGTKCAVVAGNTDMEILAKRKFPTNHRLKAEGIIAQLLEEAKSVVKSLADHQLTAIGISCGGPLDSKTGVIMSPPNLPSWDNIPITAIFSEALGVPAFLQNDANACALAEWQFGAGKGTQNMIFLTFGTGLGAGLILNGQLYSGTNDLAGEVGHLRLADDGPFGFGKRGSFEGFCSGGGIAQLAKTMAEQAIKAGKAPSFCENLDQLEEITTAQVAKAAYAGDPLAKEIFECSAYQLGRGLSFLIDILNPEVIVIGSVYARAESLFVEQCQQVIAEEAIPMAKAVCKIVPAKLGDAIGDLASLSIAITAMKK
ncbi:ROK family protein [Persicobacter psychrovividus]|uniref:N-acylmannosamine kinase n=1 Tax=Persicobacter psychrovividus TaxID=387638 RepID=A0ABM7VIL4_9BACT|nr:N-acylmannosamine kinase [Persicobacter psychrovividus]